MRALLIVLCLVLAGCDMTFAHRLLMATGGGGSFTAPAELSLFGFYNGNVGADAPQQMYGVSSSNTGRSFATENGGTATFVIGSGNWYDEHIAQGCLLQEGSSYAIYLSGFDGTNWRIGRWTNTALDADPARWFVDNGGDPIITLGAAGQPDDAGANFPQCEYDAGTGTTRIWYTGWQSGGFTTICYAERSSDGTITKYGRVINVGSVGAFDDAGLETGPCITIGGQKRIYFDGYDGSVWTQSYATYTDPRDSGTYTKQGALASLTGPLTVTEGAYGSVHLHSMLARPSGGYLGLATLFHPVGSANQREIAAYTLSDDGITFTAPIGPVVTMTTAYPGDESRENLAVISV